MTAAPLVSVIMPVYNGKKYLRQAIESILTQTFRNSGFIIIDDDSTDGTGPILAHYQKMDRRMRVACNGQDLANRDHAPPLKQRRKIESRGSVKAER